MTPARLRLALFALALACAGASWGAPRQEDPDRAVAARERYLLVNPWHPRVFREYRELLVERGAIDERGDELAARASAGESSAGVLAARLWAGAGELDRALAFLGELELADDPRAALLRAEWLARTTRLEAAARETELALATLPAGEDRERALQLALAIAAQRGARDDGERAVARLVAEHPEDLDLRLELVDELLRAGWTTPAREIVADARALAAEAANPEAWVDVHLAEARVASTLGDVAATGRAWRAALERLGRGHWRRASVRAAAFEAARATGTLGDWRDELATEVERTARLVAFEDLAALELSLGRADVAWEVLERAATAYAEDDGLRAVRLALARRTGRASEFLELLQEEVERHGRPSASLELADALVAAGRVDAARARWDRCAAEARDDAERLAEIARRRARHGEDAAVLSLLEHVAALAEPGSGAELAAAVELARHHARYGRRDAAGRVLDAAAEARMSDPAALEELGATRAELGDVARAEELWRAALARRAGEGGTDVGGNVASARLARRLARLQQDEGRRVDARETLAPFVEEELRTGRGSPTLAQLLATFHGREELARAAEREARRALAGEGGRASWHLAARGRARTGDAEGALALWRAYREVAPDDVSALGDLGLLEVETGDLSAAADTLARLEAAHTGAGRELRTRLARAFAGIGERALALRTLEPLARHAQPRDLASLVRLQLELGAVEEALATRRRATALGADDLETRLALAAALTAAGDPASGRDELRAAYGLASDERRTSIVETLARNLSPTGPEREAWFGDLVRHARARPLDEEAWSLAADLRLAWDDPRAARALLDEALTVNAARPGLLWRRARASQALGRSDAALADLRRARLLGHTETPGAAALELRALLASGRSEEATSVALASDRPRVVAEILREHGERAAAIRVLEAARDSGPGSGIHAELEVELGELYVSLGRVPEAIDAFERRLRIGAPDPRLLERIGDLHFALGDDAAGVAVGLRLLAASSRVDAARPFFERHGRLEEWIDASCARLVRARPDVDVLEDLNAELRRDARGVRALQRLYADLSEAARRAGRAPEGWSAPAWALFCAEAEAQLLRAWPGVLAGRCEALRARLSDPTPLTGREWIEFAFVAPVEADEERLARALRAATAGGREPETREPENQEPEIREPEIRELEIRELEIRELEEPAVAAALARLAESRPRLAAEFARHAARLARRLEGGEPGEGTRRDRERREIALALARGTNDPRAAAWLAAGNVPRGAQAWLDPDLLLRRATVAASAAGDVVLEQELDATLDRASEERLSALVARIEADVARRRFVDAARGLERLAARAPNDADAPEDVWRRAADAFLVAGAVPEGYAALRRLGRPSYARALIRDDEDRVRCAVHFDAVARRALGLLTGASATNVEAEAAGRTLQEATLLLLEFLPVGVTVDRAVAARLPDRREATERALAVQPDDAALRARLARLEELSGRFRAALQERRRALATLAAGRAVPRPGDSTLAALESVRGIGDVRRTSAWRILESGASLASELRLGVLRMELELGEPGTVAALEAWLAIATAVGPTVPTMLLHLLLGYDLEGRLTDHLAAVFDRYPGHGTLLRELLKELCVQERFAEARRALDRHLAAVPDPDAVRPQVARLRERVDRLEAGDG